MNLAGTQIRMAWLWSALVALLLAASQPAAAQPRLDKGGVTLYWGLVPAAVLADQHASDELHGGRPAGGGVEHHLVVALFDSATARRITDAVVRVQLSESGIVDGPVKYLTPMVVNGQASYGQVFGTVRQGPYRFKLWVRLPQRQDEIEFALTASPAHLGER